MTTIGLALALSLVAAGSRVGCVRVKYQIRCAFCVELLYNNIAPKRLTHSLSVLSYSTINASLNHSTRFVRRIEQSSVNTVVILNKYPITVTCYQTLSESLQSATNSESSPDHIAVYCLWGNK